MIAAPVQREFLTPPEAPRVLGIDVHRVLAFIREGELRASDLATKRGGAATVQDQTFGLGHVFGTPVG